MDNEALWRKKLAAWLHDPAEKALVLMRDQVGHEEGTVKKLRDALGLDKALFDRRADWYAAAADRPQWPNPAEDKYPQWANVHFTQQPVLVHPLSGEQIDLGKLNEILVEPLKHVSFDHFEGLIEKSADGSVDWKLTYLAFWRFGPETPARDLGALWQVLPADTRVPDHSIWQHLDTVSALSGAMREGNPALLAMSFGPVQSFIAQARSTSDLWASSHLLSQIVWAGLKVICECLGPDAVLFPSLRGVAAVDAWLMGIAKEAGKDWTQRFEQAQAEWLKKASDANPLFAATLPNKFMALVPASQVAMLARDVETAVRHQTRLWAGQAAQRLFDAAKRTSDHWKTQIEVQLQDFPEVHWAAADWPIETTPEGLPDAMQLESTLAEFFSAGADRPGLFGEKVWQVLNQEIGLDDVKFFKPNSGILYPAVHELAERSLAAAKSARPFAQFVQVGYRCTLCGEREWLTDALDYDTKNDQAPTVLHLPAGSRDKVTMSGDKGTAWTRIAGRFGVKAGEHLCGVCTLKRVWPSLFSEQVRELVGEAHRFVVSTHTLALATSLSRIETELGPEQLAKLESIISEQDDPAALPASLHGKMASLGRTGRLLRRLPSALDRLRETALSDDEHQLGQINSTLAGMLGAKPETYYGLIQMDGDRMGAWMAGNEDSYCLKFADTWHPQVRNSVLQRFGQQESIKQYLNAYRPASPARHASISGALNNFSTHVARHVVEEICKGKLLYTGGDDVLALVSVDDLPVAMLLLRAAYSGVGDTQRLGVDMKGLELGKGWVRLRGKLMLMMGEKATASVGVVVAHHTAPLGTVLRALREAEGMAKQHNNGARNAFCLRILKRSGGEVGVTAPFWPSNGNVPILADTLGGKFIGFRELMTDVSRRAIYRSQEWLSGLPPRPAGDDKEWRAMLASNLAFQFVKRQAMRSYADSFTDFVCDGGVMAAVPLAAAQQARREIVTLSHLLGTVEFLARESRA